jgi:hypothetical protein
MIGTTGVALDFIYQGIAKETITKIYLAHSAENQVLQLLFYG